MMNSSDDDAPEVLRQPIQGELFKASKQGFAQLLLAANVQYLQGYELRNVLHLGDSLAAIFVRFRGEKPKMTLIEPGDF